MSTMFSVIIPAYNAEAFIRETIESVLAQKDADFEVIVVDDGSRDKTLEILKGFEPHIAVYSQSNAGCSTARNLGASKAKGDILAFLDADDLWLPNKLSSQDRKFQEGYDMVYTNRFNIGDKGDVPYIQSELDTHFEGDIFEMLLRGNFVTNSSVAMKRKVFLSLGGFDTRLKTCEDWDLWLRLAINHKIGVCHEPLVKYRFHPGCKSKNYQGQNDARICILSSIFKTERGRAIPSMEKKKVFASALSNSAWAAARSKDIGFALKMYREALGHNPFDFRLWYDVARVLAGRA